MRYFAAFWIWFAVFTQCFTDRLIQCCASLWLKEKSSILSLRRSDTSCTSTTLRMLTAYLILRQAAQQSASIMEFSRLSSHKFLLADWLELGLSPVRVKRQLQRDQFWRDSWFWITSQQVDSEEQDSPISLHGSFIGSLHFLGSASRSSPLRFIGCVHSKLPQHLELSSQRWFFAMQQDLEMWRVVLSICGKQVWGM